MHSLLYSIIFLVTRLLRFVFDYFTRNLFCLIINVIIILVTGAFPLRARTLAEVSLANNEQFLRGQYFELKPNFSSTVLLRDHS